MTVRLASASTEMAPRPPEPRHEWFPHRSALRSPHRSPHRSDGGDRCAPCPTRPPHRSEHRSHPRSEPRSRPRSDISGMMRAPVRGRAQAFISCPAREPRGRLLRLIELLSSPVGGGATAGGSLALIAALTLGGLVWLRRLRHLGIPHGPINDLPVAWDTCIATLGAGLAIVPLIFSLATDDTFAAPKLSAIGFVIATTMLLVRRRIWCTGANGSDRWMAWVAGAFLGWNLLAFLASGGGAQGFLGERYQLQGLLATGLYVLTLWLVARSVKDLLGVRLLLTAVVVAAAATASYAIVQAAGLDIIWGPLTTRRAFSTIGQPNAMASLLLMAVPIAAALTVAAPSRRLRAIGVLSITVILAGLMVSGSRGGFLGLTIGGVIWGVLRRPTLRQSGWALLRRTARPAFGGTAVVIACLSVTGIRSSIALGLERSLNGVTVVNDQSAQEHLLLWKVGSAIALDNPWLGVGPERFPDEFPAYRDEVLTPEWRRVFLPFRVESPHNVYIATADAAGIPALLLYCGLMGLAIRRCLALRRRSPDGMPAVFATGVLAAIAGHATSDLFMTADLGSTWTFWALMGVAVAAPSWGRSGPQFAAVDVAAAPFTRFSAMMAELQQALGDLLRTDAWPGEPSVTSRAPRSRWLLVVLVALILIVTFMSAAAEAAPTTKPLPRIGRVVGTLGVRGGPNDNGRASKRRR